MKQIVGMKMKLLFEALAVEGGIALKVCLIVLKREFPDSPSKMIPELKFVFWQKMLMANYEETYLAGMFNSIFPNATVENRQIFYDWTDQLRELRNRIAHHEPIIFNRNLENDLEVLNKIYLLSLY